MWLVGAESVADGSSWMPPLERNVSFYVSWWEQEAHPGLEGAVVLIGWLRRGFGVGDQQYGAELVSGVC